MPNALSGADAGKFAAARRAVDLVEDGMRLGLGTGSTAAWMVRCLAARARTETLSLTCVATSRRSAALAAGLGLKVASLNQTGWLDLTIDGADEVDPALNMIKGGGGAHLQEKIVAAASDRMVAIADPGKEVARLGAFPLPVEVLEFGRTATRRQVEAVLTAAGYGAVEIGLRMAGDAPLTTDEGNRILDLHLQEIPDAEALDAALLQIPGVVQTGLFLGLCDAVIVGHADGTAAMRTLGNRSETVRIDLAEAAALPEPEAAT